MESFHKEEILILRSPSPIFGAGTVLNTCRNVLQERVKSTEFGKGESQRFQKSKAGFKDLIE